MAISILKKIKYCHDKAPILLGDVGTEKVLESKKIYFGEKNRKYFLVTVWKS